jgi:hypothetical protein
MFFEGLAVLATLALTFGQAGSQQVAGTWTMSLRGQTYARLELQTTNGALSGRMSLGAIHLNDQGEIDEVLEPAATFVPLFDIVNRDGVLTFAARDPNDGETDRFELRVNGETAQLSFLFTDEFRQQLKEDGIAAPKPVTLTRTRP